MKTDFSIAKLADPEIAEANRILRSCIHCGMCLPACPTYVINGDERDSPRGRIYLVKSLLEQDGPPSPGIVPHFDRCLTCLSCVTVCPAGVDYAHLIDRGRARVEEGHRRPLPERLLRRLLARLLAQPRAFRLALGMGRPFRAGLARLPGRLGRLAAMTPAELSPPLPGAGPAVHAAEGKRRARVLLLEGCVQGVLRPAIHAASVRLLTRLGAEVVVPEGAGCCGALGHHLGERALARRLARKNLEVWTQAIAEEEVDAIVVNASGCGTFVKDYAFLFRDDPALAEKAARVSALACDVSEVVERLGFAPREPRSLAVAYHPACGLHHGQRIGDLPQRLLGRAGFQVATVPDSHLCCGSAGAYHLLEPAFADELRARKLSAIEGLVPAVVATGNIGCLDWLLRGTGLTVVHTVELLDWATGGPEPGHASLSDG